MADFTALKTAIQNAIKQNGNEEITGNLLQEVLLAIVTTLGDGSINDLITALGSEATTRSQADGTLQQNIDAEAQARQQAVSAEAQARQLADSTLQQNINAEATTRSQADTALGGRIDGVVSLIEAINNAIENGYVYAGVATPSTSPVTGKVFYLAVTAGTYTNFGNAVVTAGLNVLKKNGSAWIVDQVIAIDAEPTQGSDNLVKSGGVLNSIIQNGSAFDLTAYNNGTTYADLSAALAALNALQAAYKKGGMSLKYVQSSDNNYVQFRCKANAFTTDTNEWVYDGEDVLEENPAFVYVEVDAQKKILWGIKADGSVYYGAGVPPQIVDYIEKQIDTIRKGTASTDIDSINKIKSFLTGFSTNDVLKNYLNDNYGAYSESPEFVDVLIDKNRKKLIGVKNDGDIYFGFGVPSQIQQEIENVNKKRLYDRAFLNEVFVAASDAPSEVKEIADYVCTGTNDEIVLNRAVSAGGPNGNIKLSQGTFYIDSFPQRSFPGYEDIYSAIVFPWASGTPSLNITITGNGERGANKTTLYVRESAWDSLPRDPQDDTKEDSSIQPCIIVSRPYQGGVMNVGYLKIELENNHHKICCINQQYNGGGILDHIYATAAPNSHADTYPTEGCVAFRSYFGSDDGTVQKWQHLVCIGFYEAFQIGAEHHILMNCGGRFNYYCFTFGNYDYLQGTNDHPIVLINCCDEHSANLPLFARCGWHDDNTGSDHDISEHPLQSVTFIGFNIEDSGIIPGTYVNKAHENTPGSFCGRIEYTMGGVGKNYVNYIFWDSNSGRNFETVNLTHAKGGSTALRQTYAANYMQHFYDTDLNKELIYNGSAWVDCNGNNV